MGLNLRIWNIISSLSLCLWICIYIYIWAQNTCACMHIAYMYSYMHVYIYTYIYLCIYILIFVYIHTYVHVYICIYMFFHMYVCKNLCICLYMNLSEFTYHTCEYAHKSPNSTLCPSRLLDQEFGAYCNLITNTHFQYSSKCTKILRWSKIPTRYSGQMPFLIG